MIMFIHHFKMIKELDGNLYILVEGTFYPLDGLPIND